MNQAAIAGPLALRHADQKYCFACAHVLHRSATQCPSCGASQAGTALGAEEQAAPTFSVAGGPAPLPAHHVYCRGCGVSIHESASTCPKCGAPQHATGGAAALGSSSRSRTVAALLALLLGGIGVHKFYLGSFFLGVLYLMFFWTAIPAIIGLIEGIYYLTLSEQDFARKYGS